MCRPDPLITLGQIGKPAIEQLIAALNDNDSRIRSGAARALGVIGGSGMELVDVGILWNY